MVDETTSPPPRAPQTAHKAIAATVLGGVSMFAGLIVGAMGLVDVHDVVLMTGGEPERIAAVWRVTIAVVSVLAAAGATGGVVYQVKNKPL